MDRIAAAAALLLVLGVGFLSLFRRRQRLLSRSDFLNEFAGKFHTYVMSRGTDEETYAWLMQNANRMQGEIGADGVVHHFKPPFANYAVREYQIIVNAISTSRQMAGDSILGSQFADYANMIRDALLRYSGSLATYEENVGRQLRNPLAWLQRGSQLVVVSPLLLLRGIGFTVIPSTGRLLGATLVKALSAIAALVGLIASVVTIAAGWDDARALVTSLGDLLG